MAFKFNLDDYLGTFAPPTFVSEGRTYTGRVWSFEEFLAMEPHLKLIAEIPTEYGPWRRHIRTILDAMFPPPSRWKRWRYGEKSVADIVLAQPLPVIQSVVMGFISAQATSQTRLVNSLAPTMDETPPNDSPSLSSSDSSSASTVQGSTTPPDAGRPMTE
jgi:hypothetical protein